ncbi:hypothetical protein E2C01_095843 [Portunus trituberculatus]|uniref:Uncharacterized protein n=1 Tax=Portunus trituberculatus TaxID=210409 RepID=A0A5B7K0G8_PORTR|nr:hypothetical protein [Portunus trituberculatus]
MPQVAYSFSVLLRGKRTHGALSEAAQTNSPFRNAGAQQGCTSPLSCFFLKTSALNYSSMMKVTLYSCGRGHHRPLLNLAQT